MNRIKCIQFAMILPTEKMKLFMKKGFLVISLV